MKFLIPSVALLALSLITFCKQKPAEPPPQIIARYTADAARYCKAIVDCMKADVKERLKAQPERRDMVVGRMDKDLCFKGQIQLLGKLSVDPGGKSPEYFIENYEAYSACSQAVADAETCADRRETHKTHPACQKLRTAQKEI